jgi:hypothetical protein
LRKWRDELFAANKELSQMGDTVSGKIIEALEQMNKDLDEQADKIERNNSLLEHYRNVIDLVGKDTLGISDEIMKKTSEA